MVRPHTRTRRSTPVVSQRSLCSIPRLHNSDDTWRRNFAVRWPNSSDAIDPAVEPHQVCEEPAQDGICCARPRPRNQRQRGGRERGASTGFDAIVPMCHVIFDAVPLAATAAAMRARGFQTLLGEPPLEADDELLRSQGSRIVEPGHRPALHHVQRVHRPLVRQGRSRPNWLRNHVHRASS
jgi:hypothetical protein